MTTQNQAFPSLTTPVVDPNGLLNPSWRSMFNSLWLRTGASNGTSTIYAQLNGNKNILFNVAAGSNASNAVTYTQLTNIATNLSANISALNATLNNVNATASNALPLTGGTVTGNTIFAGNVTINNATLPNQPVTLAQLNSSNFTKLGLGITGEIWHDLTSNRSAGTNYNNNRSYPIDVSAQIDAASTTYLTVNGVRAAATVGGSVTTGELSAIVMPNANYTITGGATILYWGELY